MRCDNTYHGALLICERTVHSFDEPCTALEPLSADSAQEIRPKRLRRFWTGRFPKRPIDPAFERERIMQQRLMRSPGRLTAAEIDELLKATEAA